MSKTVLALFIFFVIPSGFLLAQNAENFSFPSGCNSNDYMPGRVVVKFLPGISEKANNGDFISLMQQLKADSAFQKFPNSPVPEKKYNDWGMPLVDLSGIYELCFKPDVSLEYIINKLVDSRLFEYAYPHYIEQVLYTPNDPNIGSQYYLSTIKAYQAWDICKGDTNKVVGITDTGYEFNHPDLTGAVKYNYNDPIDGIDNDNDGYTDNFKGWDMGSWDNDPQYGPTGHGIHVSGLAGARADNGFGMAGVGFNGKLLPIKVDNSNGNLVATYEGIIYAADHDADVINCSWGSTYAGTLYGQDIIDYATSNCNALVVAACGNSNNMNFFYPASYDHVLSIAGTDINDFKWSNSSYGYSVDLCAPGIGIYSTWMGASFVTSGGTSMAAPIVSGAASLVSSYYPQLSMIQVAERLRTTADIIDTLSANIIYAGLLGTGRLNMYRALTDPFSPSVRLIDWVFSDSADMEFDPGDTLYVNAVAFNYLDTSSSALYARLECMTPEVLLLDSIWNIGVLNTMQSANNDLYPFRVKLLNVPPSTNIKFRVHFYDSTYHSSDFLSANVNRDYNTLDTNLLTLTVTSHGNFAFNNIVNLSQGDGFRFNNSSNLVSGFGFLCGTDMFHISDNLYSIAVPVDSDFVANNYVLELSPAPFGDQCLYSRYNDSGADSASRMNITVNQWSYAWNTPEDNNFILVKYQVINDSIVGLSNFYAGLFADFDIYNSAENRCWYDASIDALIATTLDSSIFVAIGLLSPYSSKHYATDMDGFNGSIALTDGFSESEKYTMMKSDRNLAGTDNDGNDIAALVGTGAHTIAAYDTLELTYVILAGNNLSEIAEGMNRAIVRFHDPDLGFAGDTPLGALVYPNPASEMLNFQLESGSDYSVVISDMTGRICFSGQNFSHSGSIDISSFPTGHYLIRFTNSQNTSALTFTVVR